MSRLVSPHFEIALHEEDVILPCLPVLRLHEITPTTAFRSVHMVYDAIRHADLAVRLKVFSCLCLSRSASWAERAVWLCHVRVFCRVGNAEVLDNSRKIRCA